MALVVPNTGEVIALEALVNKTAPQDLSLRLFKNNVTPAETDVAGDYTVADFTGYSNAALTGSSWGAASGGAPSSIAYGSQQTFTSSASQSAQSIYGYYLVQASSGTLVWAERFANGPYSISEIGDAIALTPAITLE